MSLRFLIRESYFQLFAAKKISVNLRKSKKRRFIIRLAMKHNLNWSVNVIKISPQFHSKIPNQRNSNCLLATNFPIHLTIKKALASIQHKMKCLGIVNRFAKKIMAILSITQTKTLRIALKWICLQKSQSLQVLSSITGHRLEQ